MTDYLTEFGVRNASLSWTVLFTVALVSLLVLESSLIIGLFGVFVFFISALPAIRAKDFHVMPPFEIVLLASIPLVARFVFPELFLVRWFNYLAVAGLALIFVTELAVFTDLRMTRNFTVFITAVFTVASAGLWALVRWTSDLYLGTSFIVSEEILMWEFVLATISGLIAGLLFRIYFDRFRGVTA